MAKARTSAGDHSNMTSVFKPVVSYAKTVGSAFADFGRAYKEAVDASDKLGAAYDGGTMVQAKKIDKPTATVMRELKEAGIQ